MRHRLQFGQLRRISEDDLTQPSAVDATVYHHLGPPGAHLGESVPIRFENLMTDRIGVDGGHSKTRQDLPHPALAGTYATAQNPATLHGCHGVRR